MGGRGSGRRKSLRHTRRMPSIIVNDLVGDAAPRKNESVTWPAFRGEPELVLTRVRDWTYSVCVCRRELNITRTVRLRLIPTSPHFGGTRYFLACPRCHALRTKLFVRDLEIVCRTCAGMTYVSQSQSREERRRTKIEAIRARLDCHSNRGVPLKPPRMHWKTYERLRAELRQLEEEELAAWKIKLTLL
jgi:hypothetical protein